MHLNSNSDSSSIFSGADQATHFPSNEHSRIYSRHLITVSSSARSSLPHIPPPSNHPSHKQQSLTLVQSLVEIFCIMTSAASLGIDTPLQFVSSTVCRGSTSSLTTHILPCSVPITDIIKVQGESPARMGLKKRTQDYPRGCAHSVGRLQQEDSPRQVSKSNNPLTLSKAGSVPVRQDRHFIGLIT